MVNNSGLAKNLLNAPQYKNRLVVLWKELTNKLNSEGPPIKSVEGWKKVWKDYKYHTKSKLRQNKKSITGTGGGPNKTYKFSSGEQQIIELLDLEADVSGFVAKTFGAPQPETTSQTEPGLSRTSTHHSPTCSTEEIWLMPMLDNDDVGVENDTANDIHVVNDNVQDNDDDVDNDTDQNLPTKRNRKRTHLNLLQKQVESQLEFHEKSLRYYEQSMKNEKEILRYLKDIKRLKEKKIKLFKEKCEDERKDRLEMRKLMQEKLRLKAEVLELQR